MPSVDSNYDAKVAATPKTPAYQYNPLPQSSQAVPAATSTQIKTFTTGVDNAQTDFNKSLAEAKKTLDMGVKAKNQFVIDSAKNLINTLNTVVKPALAILQKAENPNAGYTGDITSINKALGSGAPGSGPSGVVLGSGGKGAYSLSQIRDYMNANNGEFPPDLNTIASGITASDLTNLMNEYKSSKRLGGSDTISTGLTTGAGTPEQKAARQSAFDLLKLQFDEYGLGALVEPLRGLIQEGVSPSEFAVRLRQTDPYKKRFAANATRISSGLRALSEAEYIGLEDGYQNIMRNYGLPASYYAKGDLGRQEGFEKFIAGDVSVSELEDRISIAQKRVIDAAPQVKEALKQFYPDIKDGDILAYTLDPTQGLANIQKKVLAAEIGGAAIGAKLGATVGRAEELAKYGVTAETARAGFGAIGGGLERGRQLSSIYQEPAYTQAVAEEEVFNLPGQTGSQQKRKKIIGLEKATFGGQSGLTSGALSENRAGSY